jgi:hypothetical protein
MLREFNDFGGFGIGASDGMIGRLDDFYFDDRTWVVRHLVVDAGTWWSSRKVLLSPASIDGSDWTQKVLRVPLTTEQVRHSPDIDTARPVSRQHEAEVFGNPGRPYHWGGSRSPGGGIYPNPIRPDEDGFGSARAVRLEAQNACAPAESKRRRENDPHLRSCRAILRYRVHASDGDVGHLEDMLVDEQTLAIRYLVVNTSNWWLGRQVLVAPQWIQGVSWPDSKVAFRLARRAIERAPPYEPGKPLDRVQEALLHEHHGQPVYWADHAVRDLEVSSR